MATLDLRVMPRASADRAGPVIDGVLQVRVTRPPADGEANRAVLKLVAAALHVAPSRLVLVAGEARTATSESASKGSRHRSSGPASRRHRLTLMARCPQG